MALIARSLQTAAHSFHLGRCRATFHGVAAACEIRPADGSASSPLFRLAIILWIAFAVAACVKATVSPVRHNSYAAFHTGATLYWAGLDMYDLSFNEFRYGPAFALAFSPFLNLPMALGAPLWMGLTVGLFFWSLRMLVRDILPGVWTADREATFLLLVLATSYRGMWSAQTNTLIIVSIVAAACAIRERRWGWAALWLAIPVHIKVWPVAFVLLAMACWLRPLAARVTLAIAAIAALPLFTLWPSVVVARYHDWVYALIGPMQVRHDYRDLWTLWEIVHRPVSPLGYVVLQLATATAVLVLCLWQKRRGEPIEHVLTFVLVMWTSWQMLAGPGTERNTFGLMAPGAAWAVVTALATRRGRTITLTAFTLMFLAAIGHVERRVGAVMPLFRAAHPIGVMLICSWLVVHARRWETEPRNVVNEIEPATADALAVGWVHSAAG